MKEGKFVSNNVLRLLCYEIILIFVWQDYHVLLIYKGEGESIVYDLDTILPFPCRFTTYLEYAIDKDSLLKPEFHRSVRIFVKQ